MSLDSCVTYVPGPYPRPPNVALLPTARDFGSGLARFARRPQLLLLRRSRTLGR